MEKMNDLRDLLKHEIQDLYSAEEQIIKALPAMIEKSSNPNLKKSLSEHLRITELQKSRLDQVQQMMEGDNGKEGEKKEGLLARLFKHNHTCKGMQGIIDEANKIISEDMEPEVLDAAIIAATQKVEHYEICGYGTARTFARELGLERVALLLEQTLQEEYDADDRLTELAVTRINKEAEDAQSTSGDRTASGTSHTRSGRTPAKERISREEMELEPVSRSRPGSSARSDRESENQVRPSAPVSGGRPRSSASPRASNPGNRSTSGNRKTVANDRSSKSNSKSGSARSSQPSSGRGAIGNARSRKK